MKKVWSSPSLVQCDLLKAILESEGVDCVMKNESSARFAGVGTPLISGQALGFAWAELWVPDNLLEQATEIVQKYSQGHEETLKQDKENLSEPLEAGVAAAPPHQRHRSEGES